MKKDTFYNLIDSIYCEPQEWIYSKKLQCNNIDIFNPKDCKTFVERYLGSAGTLASPGSLADVLETHTIDDNRYQHIVFTFFIGLAIYNKCGLINNVINEKFCNDNKYRIALEKHQEAPFAYIWFLICLFHDLGYKYEYSNLLNTNIKKFDDLINCSKIDDVTIIDKLEGVPDFYHTVVEHYFKYRLMAEKLDHGICGGFILYHDLCDIRRTHKNNKPRQFNKGYWKDELELIFAYAASVVLCHNIFFASNPLTKELYIKFKLGSLITNKKYKINLKEYPIFFLFCLVDSIEPIKVVKDVKSLKKISIDINYNTLSFKTTLKCGCGEKILNNINSLNDWLCPAQNGCIILNNTLSSN